MPLTSPSGDRAIDLRLLGDFKIGEILYEAEEPIVFTISTSPTQKLLAYLADHNINGRWLLVAPCGARAIKNLQTGSLTVRDALAASWMWLVNLGSDGRPVGAWSVEVADIPDNHLPTADLPLLPDHEPLVATRAIGPQIVPGRIPASVIAFVADGTRKAVKTLLDFVLDRESEAGGRPPDKLRALYDLPVTRLAFNSFELSFASPEAARELSLFDETPAKDLARVAALLQRGLAWASRSDSSPLEAASNEERDAVLRAIMSLTPPTTGPIEAVSISGQWMVRGITILSRNARRRVHGELRRMRTEHVVRKEGRVGEVDRDRFSFILRDTGTADIKCLFQEADYEDVFDAFESQDRVAVAGVERNDRLFVAAVLPV